MEFKRAMKKAVLHCGILAKGFVKMVTGALTAGLIVFAVYGFTQIPKEGGYIAVCDFIVATVMLAVALGSVYIMGGKPRRN